MVCQEVLVMPEYDFSGKVALVTGAANGQGRSHAVEYAKHGADVVALDICKDKETVAYDMGTRKTLNTLVDQIRDDYNDAVAVAADVSAEEEVIAAVDEALAEFGQIDFLVNNAGILSMSHLAEMDEKTWDHVIDVNLKGVWLCSKHVGQHMIDRGGSGKIINISSTAGLAGMPGNGHYVASKHGVLGLTKSFALEMAEYGVNVNAVCPTGVDTPMIRTQEEEYGEEMVQRMGELAGTFNVFDDGNIDPVDVSEAVMWLSCDAARYVTGISLPVDAGFTAK